MKYSKLLSKLSRKPKEGPVVIALIAGMAAGAILGVLFAPDKGRDTRSLIRDKAKDLGDTTFAKIQNLKEKLRKNPADEIEDAVATEIPHFVNTRSSKRKSNDFKGALSPDDHHTEQAIS